MYFEDLRIGMTVDTAPAVIEKELCSIFPPKSWGVLSCTLIEFGREICHAKNPDCASCPLKDLCPFVKRG